MDQYSWHGKVARDEAELHCHGEGWQHCVACKPVYNMDLLMYLCFNCYLAMRCLGGVAQTEEIREGQQKMLIDEFMDFLWSDKLTNSRKLFFSSYPSYKPARAWPDFTDIQHFEGGHIQPQDVSDTGHSPGTSSCLFLAAFFR